MQVELASLGGKEGRFGHNYKPGELSLDDERVDLAEPPRISGQIIRTEGPLVVEAKVVARAVVECDRCLKPVLLPVDASFRLEYLTMEQYQALPAAELDEEDLALSVFDGEVIDIDEIVREQLLLAVPSHALCQPGCKGLCPFCGADKNLVECSCKGTEFDPRWTELKEIVDRNR